MKNIIKAIVLGLGLSLFLLIAHAEAGAHTMRLVDSYIDEDVKVCVYSDGRRYEELERNRASTCPSVHTFYD
ncbi:hypothetical protein ACOS7Q_24930 [Escherichia coli]|uniref:hypothetical protein n=1 Tax=Escherichia coli TaxID=562 RepID=UPI003B9CDFB5